jgi:hypothetical protein
MRNELKPCPFCGMTPELPHKAGDSSMWPNCRMFHICTKLGNTSGLMQIEISGSTDEQCIAYWNRRAEPETCNGYSVHDLIVASELLKSHMIEPNEIKLLCNNFQKCYDMARKDINEQLQKSIDSVISGVMKSEAPNA